ncbi:MAG: hypothetical protein M3O71_13655 [Bacteroidota bacterium]|nr:hypothetical protein [Bacteroidota bacterium]
MPEFISKLQHKTYEKGEFSDETVRTLDETVDVIKTFPWDNERTLTDIQLTGPSVTIQDEYVNYLKIGLYFNGKFCLYYLDCDNNLYEYHVAEMADVINVVTDFFDRQISLDKFDKHFLSAGSKKHFENASFDYAINSFNFFTRLFLFFILFAVLACCGFVIVFDDSPLFAKLFFVPFTLFFELFIVYSTFLTVKFYARSKNMYLNIASGNNQFQFGDNNGDIKNYKKSEISVINVYGPLSGKSKPILTIMEINFLDGSKIELPGLLIDPFVFRSKFANTTVVLFNKPSDLRKKRWSFANGN